jgi:protein ImuB
VLEQWWRDLEDAGTGGPMAKSRAAGPASRGRTFDILRRWGLTTIGEFAALPAAALSARLGPEGMAAQRLARGIDPGPLQPDPGVRRFLESCQLEWPIETLEPLSFVFARMLEPLSASLERADRGAIAVHLSLRLADRTFHTRMLQLSAAMRDARVLRTLLLLDLESHPPSAAIDVVTIELDPAPGRVVQFSLLERAVPSPETMATLMARLGALVGESRCGSPALPDTHTPDAFVMRAPAFQEARSKNSGHAKDTAAHRVHDDTTRRRHDERGPEANPASCRRAAVPPSSLVLRRFRPPIAIRVAVEGGRPVRVAIDRQRMPGGTVLQAAGPWRTSGGWWQPDRCHRDQWRGGWNRDEWDVGLSDGAVCRLFFDRDAEQWFLEGIFD